MKLVTFDNIPLEYLTPWVIILWTILIIMHLVILRRAKVRRDKLRRIARNERRRETHIQLANEADTVIENQIPTPRIPYK